MLEVIKMNKKQPFEAFKIPEDGIVDLVAISSWLGDNGINMRSIMLCPNCNNVHGILLRESINLFELSDTCESLHHTRMLCPNCDNDHGILLRESINLFELSDENDVKKSSQPVENKDGLNV